MCGRYYVDETLIPEIEKIVRRLDEKLRRNKKGDIFPSDKAPVITGKNMEMSSELFCWGFPGFEKNRLLINARSETVLEKRTFRDSVQHRRCVIPVRGFYEWDKSRQKYTFTRDGGKIMFLAGCYDRFEEEDRFVILTTEANESMRPVHERMPLILEEDQLRDWIFDDDKAREILKSRPVELEKYTEYEQQTLNLY